MISKEGCVGLFKVRLERVDVSRCGCLSEECYNRTRSVKRVTMIQLGLADDGAPENRMTDRPMVFMSASFPSCGHSAGS